MVELKSLRVIEEEAARWVVRKDAAPLDPVLRRQLEAWLAHDPRYSVAFRRVEIAWLKADCLAGSKGRRALSQMPCSARPPSWRRVYRAFTRAVRALRNEH